MRRNRKFFIQTFFDIFYRISKNLMQRIFSRKMNNLKKGVIRIYQISCVILKNKSKGSLNYLPARKNGNVYIQSMCNNKPTDHTAYEATFHVINTVPHTHRLYLLAWFLSVANILLNTYHKFLFSFVHFNLNRLKYHDYDDTIYLSYN